MRDDEQHSDTPAPQDVRNAGGGGRGKRIKRVCFVFVMLAALGTLGCIVAYAVTKLDVLFIPMAICAAFAIILFTYYRHSGG